MKISLAWLREFVAIELSAAEVAERLTLAGLEVEGMSTHGTYEHMVAARIVGLEPHPGADKLSLCTVDLGPRGTLRIVSGASNVEAGLRVAVALPGAVLADGRVVEPVEIRGVSSAAVLLSESEIGISDDHSGVMALGADAEPGASLAAILGTADTVLDLAITPNRGDCLSILGIAREIAALTGARLRIPPLRLAEKPPPSAERIRVDIEDVDLCRRYVARVVSGVKIGPSPLWVRSRLEMLGVRAINNVVDVTNYVMLERGQPLHAFDLARLRGAQIIVRRAGNRIVVRTLDEIDRALDADDLIIADRDGPVALAGVMGGFESAVTAATSDVLLEAAYFAPITVRRTSRRLGLRSESSLRFERGVDIEGVPRAADRAAELLAKLARGQVAAGRVDVYPNPQPAIEVLVRTDRANQLLGTALPVAEMGQSLRRVSAGVKAAGRGGYLCRSPSYRSDLTREADFVEEIARLAGYDRIPATLPRAALSAAPARASRRLTDRVRELLVAQGMNEMICHRFVGADWNRQVGGLAPTGSSAVGLRNPMSSEASEMRRSLLPNLLMAAARNRRQGEEWIRAFEIGNVFWRDGEFQEGHAIGGVLAGALPQRGLLREDRTESFYDAKGVVEALLAELHVGGVEWGSRDLPSFLHPRKAALVRVQGAPLGYVGGLHPQIAKVLDLEPAPWTFELDFEKLESYAPRHITFQPLPKYPAVVRDLAIVADEGFESESVLDTIVSCSDLPVESARLFDLYRGKPLPAGKKSLAYSIAYRAPDRTLTDDEVNRLHESLIERVTRELGVELRR
ncbi:MAG TPA: phenylalanine--tRNA ligase subunit beta [Candidatus Binatia bacterium]|nr:phenylalanine--tRNA ligase subunit beta [Candidatus Binatia bacterium]